MESTDRVQVLSCESFSGNYKLALCIENIGWSYAHQELHDKAMDFYSQAIDIYPEFVLFYENRFFSYKTKGKYLEAIADCESAIKLTSDSTTRAKLYTMIASVHILMNEQDKARELFERSIELNPQNHHSYYELAAVNPYSADHDKAVEMLNKGLSHCTDTTGRYWLLFRRSNALSFMGKLNDSNTDKRVMKSLTRLMLERID